jgi:hypothetical protein
VSERGTLAACSTGRSRIWCSSCTPPSWGSRSWAPCSRFVGAGWLRCTRPLALGRRGRAHGLDLPAPRLSRTARVAGGVSAARAASIERRLLPLLYPRADAATRIALNAAAALQRRDYGLVLRRGRAAGRPRARPR